MSIFPRRRLASGVVVSLLAVGLPLGIAGASHTGATVDFAQSANYLRSTDGGDGFDPQSLDNVGEGVNQGTQIDSEDGVVHALFGTVNRSDNFAFPFEVHHRRSTNGGKDFGPSQRVDNHDLDDPTGAAPGTQGISSEPSMATSGEGVYVVFEEGDFDFGLDVNDDGLDDDDEFPEEVFFNRSLDEGASFETSFNLSETEFAQETDSDTGASGNRVVAVYETNQIDPDDFDTEPVIPAEQQTTARDIAIRVSNDRGAQGSFAAPINVTLAGTDAGPFAGTDLSVQGQDQPKVGLSGDSPDDVVVVVFRMRSDEEDSAGNSIAARIAYVRSTDGGATFGPIEILPSGVNLEDNPSIHMEGDQAHVFACDVTNQLIQWRSDDAGATFSGPVVIHTGAERCRKSEVDGNGEDLHVVFLEEVAGEPDVFHMRSDDGGSTWSGARNLTANHGQGEFPSVAVDTDDEDDVHISWRDVSDFVFSTKYGDKVPGAEGDDFRFANEDVVRYHGSTYELVLDGSDVGLRRFRIDAMAVLPPAAPGQPDRYLLSFTESGTIPDIAERVDDSDIVLFTPTQLGEDTAGTFSLFFAGSGIGLTRSGEDVDTVEIFGNNLYLSTYGNFELDPDAYPGVSGKNEDVFVCRDFTVGSCGGGAEVRFDGSERELADSREAVDAFAFAPGRGDEPRGKAFFSTRGKFETATAAGDDNDFFSCPFPRARDSRDGNLTTCNDGLGADTAFRTTFVGDVNRMRADIMSMDVQF